MSLLEQAISELQGEDRTTLYLNEERVRRAYGNIGVVGGDQQTLSAQSTKEGSLGFAGIFGGKYQRVSGDEILIDIGKSPELMAMMIETFHKTTDQLLELHQMKLHKEDPPSEGRVVKFVGDSHITEFFQENVTAETAGLSERLARIVDTERNVQKEDRERREKDSRLFAWTAPGELTLASIALWQWADPYAGEWSHATQRKNPKGILGRVESLQEDVVFITPLWIWHVAYTL
jgi:hypothetical protein